MATQRIIAWIFDAYPEADGLRVWVLDAEGKAFDFHDDWQPAFFISGSKIQINNALSHLSALKVRTSADWTEKIELYSGKAIPVLQIRLPLPALTPLTQRFEDWGLNIFNADVHPVQAWHYERGHFPLAKCSFEVVDGRLASWELKDDRWALDYELPPLKTLHLALAASEVAGKVDPNHSPKGNLCLSFDGDNCELEGETEEQFQTLKTRLRDWDPDVITTDWGDSFLLPHLDSLASRYDVNIPFSRDPNHHMGKRHARSFFTYGRTVYQSGSRYLFGRWHLDFKNSFMLKETGMDGLFEIARVAGIPVQRAARCTIGTSLTSMQLCQASRDGILVPLHKQQTEDFRPASELVVADKGGLTYSPDIGWFEEVVEYDFVSMYPTMMVQHNISPETVNCQCCEGNEVPEIRHRICRKRQGLIPKVLAPILEKRSRYKALAKLGGPKAKTYKSRATAFKWALVTSFGYLGFRNARWGKIEAHECVTAWGREVLLKAKEAAEKRGFHMIHALVDSLWLKGKPGMDYEALRREIEEESGCPLGLEGVYKWIRFCPSKVDSLSGVPGRYFGAFKGGELKIRGIALRRRDTPPILKDLQEKMLGRLVKAAGLDGCRKALPDLLEIVEDYRHRLKDGQVTAKDLAITFNLSKDPLKYKHDTLTAVAAKQLAASGVQLHAGEMVRYVVTSSKDKVKEDRAKPVAFLQETFEYDSGRYIELLDRAAGEILEGVPQIRLRGSFTHFR